MKKEDKELLAQVLCTLLPYGLKVEVCVKDKDIKHVDCVKYDTVGTYIRLFDEEKFSIKPYLRSMSNMTEDESSEFALLQTDFYVDGFLYPIAATNMVKWLNAHHFDYRGLIERGLALVAPEGMYK